MPSSDRKLCGAELEAFRCKLPVGHEGKHEAVWKVKRPQYARQSCTVRWTDESNEGTE